MSDSPAPQEGISTYWFRGVRYAATSACAIVAGYFMGTPSIRKNDLLLLCIPILASVYFFTRYAIRFPRNGATQAAPDELRQFARSQAVRLYPILILAPYSAFVLYYVTRSETVPLRLLLSLALYVGLLIYYGRFLARYESGENRPLIRHWLIWPVNLSIAIGLFYGLSFAHLRISLLPLFPVFVLILLFVASLGLSRWLYLLLTLLVILAVTTVSLFDQAGYIQLTPMLGLSSMLFCVAASAYLAVFEAASITSDIAHSDETDARPTRYAQATLVALTATVWLLPFYYIFSSYGSPFLIGFAIHAFTSFLFWFFFGKHPYLRKWEWSNLKVIPGLLFLALLVVSPTRLFNQEWAFHFLKDFSNWGIGLLVVLVVTLVTQFIRDFVALRDKEGVESPISELFKDRVNFTRVLGLLCFVFCCGIAFRLTFVDESAPEYARAELAFLVYVICVILCFVVEITEFFRPKRNASQTISEVIGLLMIIRIFTSLLIGLAIFGPFYWAGMSFLESFGSAVPFFCAAAGGFAINDYYDAAKDRVNKPYRAIPSGRIQPAAALYLGVALVLTGTIVSLMMYRGLQLLLYGVSLVGVGIYNGIVKHFSLSKTILTAAISVLPLVLVITTLSYPFVYVLVPIAGLLFLLGRELLMDVRDIKGDRLSNMKTLPMVIGTRATAVVAFSLFALCGVVLMFFTSHEWSIRNVILVSVVLLSSLVLPYPWSYQGGKYRRPVIISLYVPILCGIFLLVR